LTTHSAEYTNHTGTFHNGLKQTQVFVCQQYSTAAEFNKPKSIHSHDAEPQHD